MVLIQPENQFSSNYMASYIHQLYLMILTSRRLSVKILGRWDFAAL